MRDFHDYGNMFLDFTNKIKEDLKHVSDEELDSIEKDGKFVNHNMTALWNEAEIAEFVIKSVCDERGYRNSKKKEGHNMTNLETMNTRIEEGNIVNNSPEYYIISNKNTNIGTDKYIEQIHIQKGPIEKDANGITTEDLILICINQLEYYQQSNLKCKENEIALNHLYETLNSIRARQYRRHIGKINKKVEK